MLKFTQGHWKWHHSKAWVHFSIHILWLYFLSFPRKSEILVENSDFLIPLLFNAPVRRVPVGIMLCRLVRKN